jgi:hypothetical protein
VAQDPGQRKVLLGVSIVGVHMESGAKEGEGHMARVVQRDDRGHRFLDKSDR